MGNVELFDEVEASVQAYKDRLRREAGLEAAPVTHWKRPDEHPFLASQRGDTTILYFGLTPTHEEIMRGLMEAKGVGVERLPTADNEAMMVGQEFCNRGQCNPHYYTIGNIIKYLRQRQAEGMSVEEIERRYVVFWASDCGPCRLGMYEAELRKALKAAGYERFRVAIMDVGHGLAVNQSGQEPGLSPDPAFFLRMARANMAADIVNDLALQIRPYEVEPGATSRALAEAQQLCRAAVRDGTSMIRALRRARRLFDAVETDYTRLRPKVYITGEFWLKFTEGDGNHRLARFLEEEKAEASLDLVGAWFEYMIWLNQLHARDRRRVKPDKFGLNGANPWLVLAGLSLGRYGYRLLFKLYRAVMGFKSEPLPDMALLERYTQGYYEKRLIAGEGHLEVTKHMHAIKHKKAHFVITVKPFGCMPSNLSDGVQAKVTSELPDSIYLAIETTGDGEVLVRSRVQMKLYEARQKAQAELDEALAAYGVSLEEVRDYARRHGLNRGMLPIPYNHRHAATAARFVELVARRMGRRRR